MPGADLISSDISSREDGKNKGHGAGMSLTVAVIFIVGELAGSGVLALPKALAGTGWIGVLLIFVCCANAAYSGIHLGYCWLILEERYEEYRGKVRYPYPAIGEKAVGIWMRHVVSVCVNITLFGASVVYLLLCSQLIASLVNSQDVSFCIWIIILGAILCPLTWLGTPSEFWPAAVGALVTTAIACILLIYSISTDAPEHHKNATFPNPTLSKFFVAFGTIIFAFGGASTFPTFQNDMKDKKQFPKAAMIGFCGLLVIYVPVAICGYYIFGDSVQDDVVLSLPEDSKIRKAVEVLLAFHFFFAFVIVFNPMAQEMEEKFKIPHKFGWKRCVLRSIIMVLVIFAGESVPHFGKILALIGGSTVTLMTFVFPPIFYMRLCDQSTLGPHQSSRLSFSAPSISTESQAWPVHTISYAKRAYLIEIICIGIVGGAVSTVSAIMDMTDPAAFTPPCYISYNN